MKIHEYQAKGILGQYNVPVPRGEVAFTADEAEVAAKNIGGSVVVKAQIHAGGRGKGGGVKIARDAAEAAEIARKMLGMKLVTHQTGPEGRIVQRLLIEETLPIERELYLGIVLDRAQGLPVFMASAAGGMEIEEVAHTNPDAIAQIPVSPLTGVDSAKAAQIGVRHRRAGGQRECGRGGHGRTRQGLCGEGLLAGRDQSVHPDQGWQSVRAGRRARPQGQSEQGRIGRSHARAHPGARPIDGHV